MPEISGDGPGGEAVVGNLPEAPRKINKPVIIGVFFILLVVVAVFVVMITKNIEKQNKIKMLANNSSHLKNLELSTNCSPSAQKSIASLQPSPKEVEASIYLLSYRANCLEQEQKPKQANKLMEQLISYEAMKNDKVAIQSIMQDIIINNSIPAPAQPKSKAQ